MIESTVVSGIYYYYDIGMCCWVWYFTVDLCYMYAYVTAKFCWNHCSFMYKQGIFVFFSCTC